MRRESRALVRVWRSGGGVSGGVSGYILEGGEEMRRMETYQERRVV